MERRVILDGHDLRAMFAAGTSWLERIAPDINALNVYPVPDGDCGTNMLLTLRTSLAEAVQLTDGSISSMAEAIAQGALMGARGNSGVILSQIWRGFSQGLREKKTIKAMDLAQALQEASETAYLALSNPVEGTILTVIRDAASAAGLEASSSDASPVSILEAAVNAARASVVNTPNLLAVLKDAGVVDAGGHGLYTFLEGALLYLKGDTDKRSPELLASQLPSVAAPSQISREEDPYGFCTQFMVRGESLDIAELRNVLEDMGKSLMVVGDSSTIRVHIHTQNPDGVTKIASSFGTLFDIDIRNMDEQHIEFLLLHREKMMDVHTAVVAVANGDGIVKVFSDLNASAIVPGGQTMNPSTFDILQTVEELPTDNIILLPNNKNVIPTALLVQSLTKKNIKVIPAETIPQGISALITFIPEDDFETSIEQMAEAITTVKTIEIMRATRATRLNSLNIEEGQLIGLLDGELLAAGDTPEDVIFQLLTLIDLKQAGVITLYHGKDANQIEAEQISNKISERYPRLEIGVVDGGQPNYCYIISVE
ncbi:MAG: DAK2 domain-containing protein [Dehalococcoidia bacterium]|nr:DAK2 domain-containing protein [Dehalococcoidia bacterium]